MKKVIQGVASSGCRRATTSTPTSSPATTRGTSGSAWCRTAISSRRSGRPRVDRHRPDRDVHRDGFELKSGDELEADIIVTATGLNLHSLRRHRDDRRRPRGRAPKTLGYKGMMLSGVPNLAAALGYTNASWTLKCDLTCEYVCRLLKHMDAHGWRQVHPQTATRRWCPSRSSTSAPATSCARSTSSPSRAEEALAAAPELCARPVRARVHHAQGGWDGVPEPAASRARAGPARGLRAVARLSTSPGKAGENKTLFK